MGTELSINKQGNERQATRGADFDWFSATRAM
jgi:hypothetical protein